MNFPMAVFVSAVDKGRDQIGLVGRSPSVDDETVKAIVPWIPRRWELAQCHAEAQSFFRVDAERFALTRSVKGRIDVGGRGEKQLVTSAILVTQDQLEVFQANAAILAMVAQTYGGLLLPTQFHPVLPELSLPDSTLLTPRILDPSARMKEVEMVVRAIGIHQRVAIVGLHHPLRYLAGYLSLLSPEDRMNLRFTVGLDVSDQRPFDLQFFRGTDLSMLDELVRLQVRTISLEETLAA